MSVLGALARRSLENPSVPLSSASLAEWIGGPRATSGVSVTEERTYGLPAYYRGIALTASTLAGLPLKVYRQGTRERVAQRTVLDSPNPRQTPFEFWFTEYANALGWGNAFGRKIRDGADVVREVWPIHPARVRVEDVEPSEADPAGKLFLVLDKAGHEQRLTSWDVFHLPYLSPTGVAGVRPLELFRQSLGTAIAADESAGRFYGQGSMIGGILSTDAELSDTQASALKARWKDKMSGLSNAHDIAVLDKGAKFLPVSIPPADAQLLESRRWSVTEIARMIGTPPHLIGDVEKSTSWGTGIEEQVLGWVKFTLNGWIILAAQRTTRELLPGGWSSGSWFAEHSLEGLLRGDSKARAMFYHQGITDGWLRRSEVRDKENLEPAPDEAGLDDFIVPSNMTLISVDGQMVPLSSDGTAATQGG